MSDADRDRERADATAEAAQPGPPDSLGEHAELAELLRTAFAPRALPTETHDRLLAAVLDASLDAVDPAELRAAEELRHALEAPSAAPESLSDSERENRRAGPAGVLENAFDSRELAEALKHAFVPAQEAESVSERALARAMARTSHRRSKVVFMSFGALGGALALAAAILLWVLPEARRAATEASPPLFSSRSLAPLIDPASPSSPSERMDRIASARERDLRENHFSRWGVP